MNSDIEAMRKERWAQDATTAGSLSTSNPRGGRENGHYVHIGDTIWWGIFSSKRGE